MSSQLRKYPVSDQVLDAILIAISNDITIQHEIAVKATEILGRSVGVRTCWQGIKYLVELGLLHKQCGAQTEHGVDFRMLSYAITSEGYRRIYLSEV